MALTAETDTSPSVGPEFFRPDLPLSELHPSPLNPRKTFDETKLDELAASIQSLGLIEPLVARPVNGYYEVVVGERRRRASVALQLPTVPVIVKHLTDTQVLEIMVVENNQREDVNPLEEADGLARLLKTGYHLDALATRIGRSRKYIYDRVKLLSLVPAAQQLVLQNQLTAGHAILIARLTPTDQARVVDPETGGAFTFDHATPDRDDPDPDADPYADVKPRSVRELAAWIDDHVRLEVTAVEPDLFPETAAAVAVAQEQAETIIPITHEFHGLPADAKDGGAIYGPHKWKRADGSPGAPACDTRATGVVVIGQDRGAAFKVCVDPSCDVHWKAERLDRARQAQAKKQAAGPAETHPGASAEQRKWEAQRARDDAARHAYQTAARAIVTAFVAKVTGMRPGALGAVLLAHLDPPKAVLALLPTPKTAEDYLRLLILDAVAAVAHDQWRAPREMPVWAKRCSVDLTKLVVVEDPATAAKALATTPTALEVDAATFALFTDAYSGDRIGENKPVKAVTYEGRLYTVTGTVSGGASTPSADARRLYLKSAWPFPKLKPQSYKQLTSTDDIDARGARGYAGMLVQYRKDDYVLGPLATTVTRAGGTQKPVRTSARKKKTKAPRKRH